MSETLVKLRKAKRLSKDDRFTQTDFEESAPFFINPRGALAHRVKSLFQLECTYNDNPWWIVDYW